MADAFEQFLSDSLAPAERLPDRRFVAGVQARIILEDRLARDRRQLAGSLLMQVAALLAVAAGVWVLGSAARSLSLKRASMSSTSSLSAESLAASSAPRSSRSVRSRSRRQRQAICVSQVE
jgi:hypothetical protein